MKGYFMVLFKNVGVVTEGNPNDLNISIRFFSLLIIFFSFTVSFYYQLNVGLSIIVNWIVIQSVVLLCNLKFFGGKCKVQYHVNKESYILTTNIKLIVLVLLLEIVTYLFLVLSLLYFIYRLF